MPTKHRILAISIGLIYILFGGLKFFPTLSPAENIGIDTVQKITFSIFSSELSLFLLALLEVGIGMLLMCNKCLKMAIVVALFHMVLTFAPILLFPAEIFSVGTAGISLLGQYILKNIVIICALISIYPTSEIKDTSSVRKLTF